MSDELVFSIKGLENLIKALKGKPPRIDVGVSGAHSVRTPKEGSQGSLTNVQVGAIHEFGDPVRHMPQRSFLRVPLSEHLEQYMERSGFFDKRIFDQIIQQGSVTPWLNRMSLLCKTIVDDAFDTGGFGQWPAWRDPHYQNQTGKLLLDTQQLKESITAEVRG